MAADRSISLIVKIVDQTKAAIASIRADIESLSNIKSPNVGGGSEPVAKTAEELENLKKQAEEAAKELGELSEKLNLSPDQVIAAAQAYEKLKESGVSTKKIQEELNKQYGLSKSQVDELGKSLEKTKQGGFGGLVNQGQTFLGVLFKMGLAVGGVVLALKALEKFAPEVYEKIIARLEPIISTAKGFADAAVKKAQEIASPAKGKAQELASGAREKAQGFASSIGEKAQGFASSVGEKFQEVRKKATTREDGSAKNIFDYAKEAKEAFDFAGNVSRNTKQVLGLVNAIKNVAGVAGDAKKAVDGIGGGGGGGLGGKIAGLAFQFNNVVGAIQTLAAAAGPLYDGLIGSNERLNAQILSSQTNLASATRIFKNGVEIIDPTEKIKSTGPQLKAALKQIEKDTESLVGVTSSQVNELFQITLTNASALNKQSKEFPGPIEAATSLTKGWAASLKVIGVPLDQARQEINSIIKGEIDNNSILAKNLQISSADVRNYKAKGTLVDELNKRLETFVAGNAIAARSVDGIGSNIKDIFERLQRESGASLLEPIVQGLESFYNFLKKNEGAITEFFKFFGEGVSEAVGPIGESLLPAVEEIGKACAGAGPLIQDLFTFLVNGLKVTAAVVGPTLKEVSKVAGVIIGATKAITGFFLIPQAKEAAKQLDMLGEGSKNLAKDTERVAKGLEELAEKQKDGGKLSEEQVLKQKALRSESKNLIPQIDAQIKGYQGLIKVTPSLGEKIKANIAALEAQKKTLEGDQTLELRGKSLSSLGSVYEDLKKKSEGFDETIKNDGNGVQADFDAAVKGKQALIQQRLELGQITAEEAQIQLKALAENDKVSSDLRIKAGDEIAKVQKQATSQLKEELDAQLATVEGNAAKGSLTQSEAAQKTTEIKKQQLQLQLDDIEKSIANEEEAIAQGRGSATKLKSLQEQQKKIQADGEKETIEGEKRIQAAKLNEIEQANTEANAKIKSAATQREIDLQKLVNAGTISEDEANQRKTKGTEERLKAEYDAEVDKLNKLKELPLSSNPEEARKQQQQISQQEQKLAELNLQRLQNQAQAEEQARQLAIKAIKQKQELEQQGTEKSVLAIQTQITALDKQKNAQEVITRSIERQGKLLQSNSALTKALSDAAVSRSEGALNATQKAIALQESLKTEEDPIKRQAAEAALARLGFNSQVSQLALVQQKQAIEDRIAQQKALALKQEQEQARAQLELDLRREASAIRLQILSAKRAESEAKIALLKAQQALSDAQSEVKQAALIKDPKERAIAEAKAQNAVEQAKQGIEGAKEGVELATTQKAEAEQAAKDQEKIAANSKAVLDASQGAATAAATQAENLRQVDKILELAAAKAEDMKKSLEGAANASGQIGGGRSVQARFTGGPVEAGQPYLGGEAGTELLQMGDRFYPIGLNGPELFTPSSDGFVHNAGDSQNLVQSFVSSAASDPARELNTRTFERINGWMGGGFLGDRDRALFSEIFSQAIADVPRVSRNNTTIVQGDSSDVREGDRTSIAESRSSSSESASDLSYLSNSIESREGDRISHSSASESSQVSSTANSLSSAVQSVKSSEIKEGDRTNYSATQSSQSSQASTVNQSPSIHDETTQNTTLQRLEQLSKQGAIAPQLAQIFTSLHEQSRDSTKLVQDTQERVVSEVSQSNSAIATNSARIEYLKQLVRDGNIAPLIPILAAPLPSSGAIANHSTVIHNEYQSQAFDVGLLSEIRGLRNDIAQRPTPEQSNSFTFVNEANPDDRALRLQEKMLSRQLMRRRF